MTARRTGTSIQRLFFALWPDPATRKSLSGLQSHLPASKGRPVPAENLHLTLVFLGHVDPEARACMEVEADQVTAAAFELVFTHLGCWPRPRVIWTATESMPNALKELVSTLGDGMARCGLRAESRPFRAHVTLARKARAPADFHAVCGPVRWRVDAFHLIESKTLSSGADYLSLRSWPLFG